VHAGWLAGLWWLAWDNAVQPLWLALFFVLQAGRVWVLATLGRRWTTRIIVLPDAPLVRRGPFRFVSHPNYLVVAGEIAALPLAFGLPGFALLFSLLNAAVLTIRIRAESRALNAAQTPHLA
jgi:methyltransferase